MLKDLWHDTKWLVKELALIALVLAVLWVVGSGMQSYLGLFGVKF